MHGSAPQVEELLIHGRWLYRLAFDIVRDTDLAQDLVQETWLAALRSAPPPEAKVQPWLAGVLRNLARMSARTAVRRRTREQVCADEEEGLVAAPSELLARLEAHELLVAEVRRLDEPFRTTLLLLYVEQLPSVDVAERLGVAESTVRWRRRHALDQLRRALADKDPQHRRLRLLFPVGAAAAALGGGELVGAKALWGGLLVLATLLALLGSDGSRGVVPLDRGGRPGARAPAAAPADPLASLAAAEPRPGESGELLVRVTDLADQPIAGATAATDSLAIGATAADGWLDVLPAAAARLPATGTIAVEAPGYLGATAIFRRSEPLHLHLSPLEREPIVSPVEPPAGEPGAARADPVARRLAAGSLPVPRWTPPSTPPLGRPPSPVRCTRADLLNLNRVRKELSMLRLTPKVQAMVLAMAATTSQTGCLEGGDGAREARQDELTEPSDPAVGDDAGAGACEDPCAALSGEDRYSALSCADITLIEHEVLSCAAARTRCQELAESSPDLGFVCVWGADSAEIFRHESEGEICEARLGPPPTECPSPSARCSHPCTGTEGVRGTYRGFDCGPDGQPFVETDDIECVEALGNCATSAASNPDQNVYCEWNGQEIYRREVVAGSCNEAHGEPPANCAAPPPELCDGAPPCQGGGTDMYRLEICEPGYFRSRPDVTCQAALGDCILVSVINPHASVNCQWAGRSIYRRETDGEAGACDAYPAACEEPPTCSDPCEGQVESSWLEGLGCQAADTIGRDTNISCQDARDQCGAWMSENPDRDIICLWAGIEVGRQVTTESACDEYGEPPSCIP